MSSRTLPGIGLTGFWDLHAGGWKPDMDSNLLNLSVLVQPIAKSSTTALPGSPTDGDVYIVPSSAGSNPNKIAIRDNGAWAYITPKTGWEVYVIDTSSRLRWSGTAWISATVGGGGANNLIGMVSARLPADFTVTSGAWRSPTGTPAWTIDRDNLTTYTSNSDFTVPAAATFARARIMTAWGSAGAVVYCQAYDTTDNTSYVGDIRDRNNEALSSVGGLLVPCTAGRTIRFQWNSGSASGVIGGVSGSVFGKPTRIEIEWYSGYPI